MFANFLHATSASLFTFLNVKFFRPNCSTGQECDWNNKISQNVQILTLYRKNRLFFEKAWNFSKSLKVTNLLECVSIDIILKIIFPPYLWGFLAKNQKTLSVGKNRNSDEGIEFFFKKNLFIFSKAFFLQNMPVVVGRLILIFLQLNSEIVFTLQNTLISHRNFWITPSLMTFFCVCSKLFW